MGRAVALVAAASAGCLLTAGAGTARATPEPWPWQIHVELYTNVAIADAVTISVVDLATGVATDCHNAPVEQSRYRLFLCNDLAPADYAVTPIGVPDGYSVEVGCARVDAAAPRIEPNVVPISDTPNPTGCKVYAFTPTIQVEQWGSGFDIGLIDGVRPAVRAADAVEMPCASVVLPWDGAVASECDALPAGEYVVDTNAADLGLSVVDRWCTRVPSWFEAAEEPILPPQPIVVADVDDWQLWSCGVALAAPLLVSISAWESPPADLHPIARDAGGGVHEPCADGPAGGVPSTLDRDWVFCGPFPPGPATIEVVGVAEDYTAAPLACDGLTIEVGRQVPQGEIATPRCGISYEPTQETLQSRAQESSGEQQPITDPYQPAPGQDGESSASASEASSAEAEALIAMGDDVAQSTVPAASAVHAPDAAVRSAVGSPATTASSSGGSGVWPVLAGLMFTAFAFTMAWRYLRRRRRRQ